MKALLKAVLLSTLVSGTAQAQTNAGTLKPEPDLPFTMTQVATFNRPWRIAFLPDGRMLVTEKVGPVWLVTPEGAKTPVANAPAVLYGGQGGMLGIFVSPKYADGSQRLSHLLGAGRCPGRVEPGDGAGQADHWRGLGEPRRPAGALARHAEGTRRAVRRADRVFAGWPVSVPGRGRSPAHDAGAGPEHGSRQDSAPDARRQARAG